jgi:tetratricopeptide (TPR) repeat protein
MGKLLDIFVEWARKERRWPLLAPLLLPALIKFSQEYFHIPFREATTHWSVLLAGGALLVATGALYCVVQPQGLKERLWLGGSLTVVGLSVVAAGVWQLRPALLPSDHLIVAIARLSAVTPGARDDADNLAYSLEQVLRDKQQSGLSLEVKRLTLEVTGTDERSRRAAAVAIAKSREGSAHVVVWGDVRRDEGNLYVEPRLTVARPLGKELPGDRSPGRYSSEGPSHISFKQRLSTDVAELVTFLYGLALFNAGQWKEAGNVFEKSQSPANRVYHATTLINLYIDHFRKTGEIATRLDLLNSAEVELRAANQALLDAHDFNLAALGLIKQGHVYRMQAQWPKAIELYNQAEDAAKQGRDVIRQAEALAWRALAESSRLNLGRAFADASQAVTLAESTDDKELLARALDILGTVQLAQGDLSGAEASLNREITVASEAKDPNTAYFAYLNRSDVYFKSALRCDFHRSFKPCYQELDRARADLERARAIADKLGHSGLARKTQDLIDNVEVARTLLKSQEATYQKK